MTTEPFTFSITDTIRQSWALFKKHAQFFVVLGLVSVILGLASNNRHIPGILSLVVGVASYLWTIVWLKTSLAVARGDETKLSFGALQQLLPTFTEALLLAGVGLLSGLLVLAGFVLLIIPGLYVLVRLSFANLAYLDRKEGVRKSLRYSWSITKGDRFWTTLLAGIVALGLYLVGILFFGVGILATYPLAMLLVAKLYVALSNDHSASQAIAPQPQEIPASTPEASPEESKQE